MRRLVLFCITFATITSASFAQTLFTYGKTAVTKDEFLKVYQKNSLNKKPDFSEPALREYLNLYSVFRMKVAESREQQIDTMSSIQYELNNYRKQLAKNYLTDEQMNEKLMKEAYERMKEDVNVAHILIYSSQYSPSSDTVELYRKIDSIYNVIIKGKADFATMAAKYSDDKDTKVRGGNIGYITAMQTVYPFENAAYNTSVGKISKPFRTQFGYHIVKVIDRRPATGQAEVAHILLNTPKSKGEQGIADAKAKMDTIITKLKAGAKFEDMVKQYSEDKFSINEAGVLKPFGVGELSPEFENAAFALKKPGDLSAPVQTDYGIHLIKLISKRPLRPYDSVRILLKRKVENDSRAQIAKEAFINKIKQQNGFVENSDNYNALVAKVNKLPDTGKNANTFILDDFKSMAKPVFTFAGRDYSQYDLMKFADNLTRGRIMGVKSAVMQDIYKMYVNNVLNDFEEHKLVEDNPEFKALMDEYTDGIMLFELMDRNVWSKASRDSTGLKAFYETKKNKYQWEPGFKGAIYIFKNEAAMKEGKKLLSKKDVTDQDLVKKLNSESKPDEVTIQRSRYEFSKYKDFPESAITQGKITEAKKNADGTYTIVKADEVFATAMPKSLDEAKGYIIAEYQDYLEKTWNDNMRKKYPVTVVENVFKSMVK